MLSKIRRTDVKKILWILLILIVPAFVFWGANRRGKNKVQYAGTIYGRKVLPEEYYAALHNTQVLFLISLGRDYLNSINTEDLVDYTWQNLLILAKAEKEKITVSDEEVIKKIRSFALLNNQEGKFSKEKYLTILQNLKILPGQFEEFLKDQIKIDKLKERIQEDATVTEEELLEQYKIENEEARIKYVFIDLENIKTTIKPENEQLQDYFEKNKEKFRVPPKVKIAYILLKDEDRRILEDVAQQMQDKKSLNEISKILGLEITESGFFSINEPIEGLGWDSKISEQAHKAESGLIQGPLQSKEGIVFFTKTDSKKSYIPDLSTITDTVKEELINDAAYKKAKNKALEIISKIKQDNIKDLKVLGSKFPDSQLLETNFFKRLGFIENIGMERNFNNRVFTLKKDEILLEPLEVKKGFCIVQLMEIKPIDQEQFNKDKEMYANKLLQNKKAMAMNTFLLNLLQESKMSIAQQ